MEPKFQSSFIPKSPVTASIPKTSTGRNVREKSLVGFLAMLVFVASVILAFGVFGYKFYLKYSIEKMGISLESARAVLQPEAIRELTRLDNRLVFSQELIGGHKIISPLFDFLETSTPVNLRFSSFSYTTTDRGVELVLGGQARGYTTLALLSEVFNETQYFLNPIFFDINLNERGEVVFSFRASVDPGLITYKRVVGGTDNEIPISTSTPRELETVTTSDDFDTSVFPEDGLTPEVSGQQNISTSTPASFPN